MNKPITKYELTRKLVHILTGLILIVLTLFHLPAVLFWIVLICGIIFSLSLRGKGKFTLLGRILRNFDKKNYLPAHGLIFFVSAYTILISLKEIFGLTNTYIILPILVLSIADPASFFAGRLLGKHKLPFSPHRTWEGTLGGILMSILVCLLFLSPPVAVIVGLISMSMDMFEVKISEFEVDDNLLIPLAALAALILILPINSI